jgi:hypothetical protein
MCNGRWKPGRLQSRDIGSGAVREPCRVCPDPPGYRPPLRLNGERQPRLILCFPVNSRVSSMIERARLFPNYLVDNIVS